MELSDCPVATTMSVIGGKWKPLILYALKKGTKRFGELKREAPGVSHKVLTESLRELEEEGVVQRTDYDESPPRVEYSLTDYGETLRPVLKAIAEWGVAHRKKETPPC